MKSETDIPSLWGAECKTVILFQVAIHITTSDVQIRTKHHDMRGQKALLFIPGEVSLTIQLTLKPDELSF